MSSGTYAVSPIFLLWSTQCSIKSTNGILSAAHILQFWGIQHDLCSPATCQEAFLVRVRCLFHADHMLPCYDLSQVEQFHAGTVTVLQWWYAL